MGINRRRRRIALGALACLVAASATAQNGALDGTGAYVVTVAAGVDVTLDADDAAALGTAVDLVKRGAGRLVLATDLKAQGWAGEARVEEGYLRARARGALGTTAKGVVVLDGATFEVDGSDVGENASGFLEGEPFTVAGCGMKADGAEMGAIRNVANGQYPGIGTLTLAGDSLYASSGDDMRLDVRGARLNLNGHTFATRGSFALTAVTVEPQGGHIAVESGVFTLESSLTFKGDAANRLTVASDAQLLFQGAQADIPWTLVLQDGATAVRPNYGTKEEGRNVWAGPVALVSGFANLRSEGTAHAPLTFTGNVTGAGGVRVTSTAGGFVRLLGAANTFTGGLVVSASDGGVWAQRAGSLGADAGDVRLTGARAFVRVPVDDGTAGWSMADYRAFRAKAQVTGSDAAVVLWNADGETATLDEAVATARRSPPGASCT